MNILFELGEILVLSVYILTIAEHLLELIGIYLDDVFKGSLKRKF
jgi:hypothetical protein